MMRPQAARLRKPPAGSGRTRRKRWPILAGAGIVVVLAMVWVWLWYYAASIADRTLSGWVEREAAAGRVYSCGTQSIGGFPFGIHAHCVDAATQIKSNLPPYDVKAKSVTFAAEVYRPTWLTGDVVGPITVTEPGQPPSFVADWTRARVSVHGVPPDPEGVAFDLNGPHLDRVGGAGGSNETLFGAKLADLQGHIVAGSPRDRPVIELTLRLDGATAPTLHPFFAAPVEVELDAVLRGFKDLAPKPFAERFREMQAANGDITIKALRIAQGNAVVAGAGRLTVNERGKLDGLVRVAIVDIEDIVPLLGIDRLVGAGIDRLSGTEGAAAQGLGAQGLGAQGMGALDRLIPGLGGAIRDTANASLIENLKKMGEPTVLGKAPAIILPLRFADGAVYLGMLRVGEMPPLF
jgi:hypothetical protein